MLQSKFLKTVLLALVIVGGIWALVNRDQISEPADALKLAKDTVTGWLDQIGSSSETDNEGDSLPGVSPIYPEAQSPNEQTAAQLASHPNPAVPSNSIQGVVRIGSFKMNPEVVQFRHPEALDLVADLCRQYDVMVLHNLERHDTLWIKLVTERMNRRGAVGAQHLAPLANGNRSDYVAISDRQQRKGTIQTVILFNRQTIQLDQMRWYLVNDQAGAFEHDPMVAWFRVRGVPPQLAFTFSLAAVDIQSRRPDLELKQLGTLFRAIRNDGRGEDDVIVVGDFQADDRGLDAIKHEVGLAWIVNQQPTTIRGDRQLDNIVFGQPATVEFTGRGGVIPFPQQFQLSLENAMAISDRLPVWAEFSVYESGLGMQSIPGRVALGDHDPVLSH